MAKLCFQRVGTQRLLIGIEVDVADGGEPRADFVVNAIGNNDAGQHGQSNLYFNRLRSDAPILSTTTTQARMVSRIADT